MYQRKRPLRVWAAIPAVALIIAISAIAGPANAATPTVLIAVGTTALQIPVAVTVQRLPATSTTDTSGERMLLGFLIGSLGTLLILGPRKSLIQRVINIYTR